MYSNSLTVLPLSGIIQMEFIAETSSPASERIVSLAYTPELPHIPITEATPIYINNSVAARLLHELATHTHLDPSVLWTGLQELPIIFFLYQLSMSTSPVCHSACVDQSEWSRAESRVCVLRPHWSTQIIPHPRLREHHQHSGNHPDCPVLLCLYQSNE